MIKKLLLASAMVGLIPAGAIAQSCKPADLVLKGGTVYTVNDLQPKAEAVAVLDKKIIYVGDNIGVERYACGDANIIELDGKTVFPGFIDSHVHVMRTGFREKTLNLQGINSLAEMLAATKKYADDNPDMPWITGIGWIEKLWPEARFPTMAELDEIIPDRPVFLGRSDGHTAIINTKAMTMAGITADTPSPDGGAINHDENGEPNGILVDNAKNLVTKLIPEVTDQDIKEAIKAGSIRNARYGWTSVHDAGSYHREISIMRELLAEGNLYHRIYEAVNFGDIGVELIRNGMDIDPDHMFNIRGIKIRMDGALGSRGAAFIEPYSDYDTHGFFVTPPDDIRPVLVAALKAGIQIESHAIGDDANRVILDLYEEAFKAVPKSQRAVKEPRWRVEHAQNIQPGDVKRFGELNIIASMQASHAIGDLYFAGDRLGLDRLRNAYPWRSLLDEGVIIAGGSDQPAEVGDPVIEFYASVVRKDLNGFSGEGWHPELSMTREEALKSLTLWGAYAAFQDHVIGSIKVGKLADFSILDKDIMTVPEEEITSAKNVMTIVNGRIVYQ